MFDKMIATTRPTAAWYVILPFVATLVVVVVGVDMLFFRHHFWYRLTANVGIVLAFAALGWRFLERS
jgi:predicted cobalt transporter CbtA